MRRKLMVFSLFVSFLLAILILAIILTGMIGWIFFKQETKSRLIRITSLAPLSVPVIEEVTKPPASETETVPDNQPLQSSASSPDDAQVEQILGFSLPPGTVNSITKEGAGSRIVIPKLNLDASIVLAQIRNQTWYVDDLEQAVGHLEGTAAPGSDGNIALAGHVTLEAGVNGPFAGLGQLVPGDLVIVYKENEKFHYVVDSQQVVSHIAVEVTNPSKTGEITLITCTNWDRESGEYTQRLVVKGHLVEG